DAAPGADRQVHRRQRRVPHQSPGGDPEPALRQPARSADGVRLMVRKISCIVPNRLRRLRASESGLALTEFAIALPVLLVLLLGGLETSNLALTHLRVNQIAMTVADNAGRVRTGIDESHIYEVFAGADLVGSSI